MNETEPLSVFEPPAMSKYLIKGVRCTLFIDQTARHLIKVHISHDVES